MKNMMTEIQNTIHNLKNLIFSITFNSLEYLTVCLLTVIKHKIILSIPQ